MLQRGRQNGNIDVLPCKWEDEGCHPLSNKHEALVVLRVQEHLALQEDGCKDVQDIINSKELEHLSQRVVHKGKFRHPWRKTDSKTIIANL